MEFLLSLKVTKSSSCLAEEAELKVRLVKNKMTIIVEKSFKAFSISIGTVGLHNIATVKGWNSIGLEVEQKKGSGHRKKP